MKTIIKADKESLVLALENLRSTARNTPAELKDAAKEFETLYRENANILNPADYGKIFRLQVAIDKAQGTQDLTELNSAMFEAVSQYRENPSTIQDVLKAVRAVKNAAKVNNKEKAQARLEKALEGMKTLSLIK